MGIGTDIVIQEWFECRSYALREKINKMPDRIVIAKAIPRHNSRFPLVASEIPRASNKKEYQLPPSQQLPEEPQQGGTRLFRSKLAELASFAG